MKRLDIFALAISCLLVAACAAPVATRLTTSGPGLAAPARLTMLAPEPDGAPANAALQALAEKSLATHGYSFVPEGAYFLDIGFSQRSADISVNARQPLVPISPSQKKSFLSRCKKQVHRLTLSVIERASGASVYQGTAEETLCDTVTAESLPYLVEALTADLAKPGGERLLKRPK
jgi:hypothetical protein